MPELISEQLVQNRAKKPSYVNDPHINQAQDAGILEVVRDTTFISKVQLGYICKKRGIAKTRQTLKWRLDRLLRAELIAILPVAAFPFQRPVYSITRAGLKVLEEFGRGLDSITSDSEHLASFKQANHFLSLNEIMFQFDRCFKIHTYMCDRVLRSYNMTLASPLAKDYDAFVTIDRSALGKDTLTLAVEYEATLKSGERYRDISAALNQERQVRLVVYFCGSMGTANLLATKLTSRTCHVCLGSYTDFRRDGAETKMLFRQQQETHLITLGKLIEVA